MSWTGQIEPLLAIGPSDWGKWGSVKDAQATIADPLDACTPLTNSVAGGVVVLERGGCAFSIKAYHAQQVGAEAALIINSGRAMGKSLGAGDRAADVLSLIHI